MKPLDRTIWQALSWKGRIIFIIIILPFVFGLSCLIGLTLFQIALNIVQ